MLRRFIGTFDESPPPDPKAVELGPIADVLADLIRFVTEDTEQDVERREGLPIPARQTMLREQGLMDLAVACMVVPFRKTFDFDAIFGTKVVRAGVTAGGSTLAQAAPLRRICNLAMRFCRHLMRDSAARHATRASPARLSSARITFLPPSAPRPTSAP